PIGQRQPDHDRDGRAMHAAKSQALRDLPRDQDAEADEREGGDEAVVGRGFFKDFKHGVHSASASKGLSWRVGAGTGSSSRRSARLITEMTMAQSPAAANADSSATGPPRSADTMSCWAAMATTTGMYIAPQYSTPNSVSLGSMSFFCI